jgi:uncharacterized membrane protein YbhN (UPF0104 family)
MSASTESRYLRFPQKMSFLLVSLSLLATVSLILLLATQFDLSASLSQWSSLPIAWLLLCFGLLFISNIVRAARLYYHFYGEMKGDFSRCLRIALHHNFFNNLLPLRAGEATLPLLLRHSFAISLTQSTAALLTFRLFDLSVLALLGLLTLLFGQHQTGHLTALLIVLLVSALIALITPILLTRLSRHWPGLKALLDKVRQGLPRGRKDLLYLLLWSVLIWGVKLSGYAIILLAFTHSTIAPSLLAALSGEFASGIPLYTPAAFGTFEGGIVAVLLAADIKLSVALTAAINLHLFILVATLISAGFGLTLGRERHGT